MKDETNIYQYSDYRRFLKDKFAARRQISKIFSHRYFAKKAGFHTPSFLQFIINGKRNLTLESIRKFARGFDMTPEEFRYFEAMVLFNQAATVKEKEAHYQRMVQLKRAGDGKLLEQQQLDYFSHWYIPVIREMIALNDFNPSAKWISDRLCFSVPLREISKALKLLADVGLVRVDGNGSMKVCDSVIATDPEVSSVHVACFHKEMLRLAHEAVDRIPSKDREITSLTASMSRECFEEIKTRVRSFKKELTNIIVADKNAEQVYQINFNVFPVVHHKRRQAI